MLNPLHLAHSLLPISVLPRSQGYFCKMHAVRAAVAAAAAIAAALTLNFALQMRSLQTAGRPSPAALARASWAVECERWEVGGGWSLTHALFNSDACWRSAALAFVVVTGHRYMATITMPRPAHRSTPNAHCPSHPAANGKLSAWLLFISGFHFHFEAAPRLRCMLHNLWARPDDDWV